MYDLDGTAIPCPRYPLPAALIWRKALVPESAIPVIVDSVYGLPAYPSSSGDGQIAWTKAS